MIKKIFLFIVFILLSFQIYSEDSYLLMIAAKDLLYSENGAGYYIKAEFEVHAEKDGEIRNYGPKVLTSNPSNPDDPDNAFVIFPGIPEGSVITIINTSNAYISDTVKIFVPLQISEAYSKEMETFSESAGKFSTKGSYYKDIKDWPWYHCESEMEISESSSIVYQYDYTNIHYRSANTLTQLVIISPELEYVQQKQNRGGLILDAMYFEDLLRKTDRGPSGTTFFEENLVLFIIIIAVIAGIISGIAASVLTLIFTKNIKKPVKKKKEEKEPKYSKVKYTRKKWTIQELIEIDRVRGRYY